MPYTGQKRPRTQYSCIPAGEYDADIISIERATSKAGNDMAVVKMLIIHGGKKHTIRDWIVKQTPWKIDQLAASLGKQAEREAGTFRLLEQPGRMVRVRISLTNDPTYGWGNKVEAYLGEGHGTDPLTKPMPESFHTPQHPAGEYPF